MASRGHGSDNRGLEAGAMPGVAFGRYGAMFDLPSAGALPDEAIRSIARAMIKADNGKPLTESEGVDENPTIPSGYTYFGQFVDHDITFDPTPVGASNADREALVDFRSPALDLDSVYGRGPDDQPYMYEGLKLRVGQPVTAADAKIGARNDLFRLDDGTPVLGDKRNDENKIVSQFHGAITRMHNKVVEDSGLLAAFLGHAPTQDAERFRAAAAIVRHHYQWVVVFDFLDRICEPGMVSEVLNLGGTPRLRNYLKTDAAFPYMPIEFSGAAFRFGHSMVRPSYSLNTETITAQGGDPAKQRIQTFSRTEGAAQNLNGFPGTLTSTWGIDFGFFLDTPAGSSAEPRGLKVPQPSYRIDALLSGPLADLPEFFRQTDLPENQGSLVGHLAFRNLQRGQMLDLPSGQAVSKQLGIEPLSDDILWSAGSRLLNMNNLPGDSIKDIKDTNDQRDKVKRDWVDGNTGVLRNNTPLWYYILREAEYYGVTNDLNEPWVGFGGQHLGPVGSRIVAETLVGLLWLDKNSFLHDSRGFRPMPQITGGEKLNLPVLLQYALG